MRIVFLLFFLCFLSVGKAQDRPNIILILADDMGYSDLGCTGGEIPTPNLDQLAANGLLMPNFYNAARCCPTRASLLTGLYPHQAGMGDMVEGRLWKDSTFLPAYQGWLSDQAITIAEALKQGGYQTLFSGKWHLGNDQLHWPGNRGFDQCFAMIHGAGNYFNDEPWVTEDQFIHFQLNGRPFEPGEDFYMTDAVTDYALQFMNNTAGDQPFFLYLSYTAPHWPLHALAEDIQRFQGQYLAGWEKIRAERVKKMQRLGFLSEKIQVSVPYQDEQKPFLTPKWDTLSQQEKSTWDLRMAVYAAQVYAMDRGIGKVVNQLKASKQLDNTLILFLSDNGATHAAIYLAKSWVADRSGAIGSAQSFDSYGAMWGNVSNTPYRLFKNYTTEGGIKTPLIAHYPRLIAPSSRSNDYAHVIDILPTCLELAEVSYPTAYQGKRIKPTEGTSLVPVFEKKKLPADRPIIWEHQGSWAIRKGKWKLVTISKKRATQESYPALFDLENDPTEMTDLSDQYPKIVEELLQLYKSKAAEMGVVPVDSLILARKI